MLFLVIGALSQNNGLGVRTVVKRWLQQKTNYART
jgi:hypothetical protein